MTLTARQLIGTWIAGSATTGTTAVLFTLDRGFQPFVPLAGLPGLSLAGVLGMLAALFAALALLAWGTVEVTWLPVTARGMTLWTVVVGGAGLAGWAFAAAGTFAAEFPLWMQLATCYVFGGLPFALVAAMLLRPVAANVGAVVAAVLLLVIGVVLMRGDPVGVCGRLLALLFGGGVRLL